MLKVNKKRKECVTSWLRLPTSLPSFSYFLYCTYTKRENVHENASPSLLKKVGKKIWRNYCQWPVITADLYFSVQCMHPPSPHPSSLSDYAPFCCSECTGNSFPLKYNNVPMVELINELWEAVWFWQLVTELDHYGDGQELSEVTWTVLTSLVSSDTTSAFVCFATGGPLALQGRSRSANLEQKARLSKTHL